MKDGILYERGGRRKMSETAAHVMLVGVLVAVAVVAVCDVAVERMLGPRLPWRRKGEPIGTGKKVCAKAK